jgi:hypothetical protein
LKVQGAVDEVMSAIKDRGMSLDQALSDYAERSTFGPKLRDELRRRVEGAVGNADAKSPDQQSSRPSIDHSILSPSGRVSKRSEKAAKERASLELFGPQGLARPQGPTQPTEQESLRRYAAELRGLAERGMKPIAYAKKAKELEDRANELDKANQPAPADTIRDDAAAGDQEKNSGAENIEFKPVSKQAGELQDRKKQVETWIEALKNRKPTTRYSEYPDKEVVSLLDQHAERIHRLRKWEREHGPLAEGDQERLDKDLVRQANWSKNMTTGKNLPMPTVVLKQSTKGSRLAS